MNIEAMKVRMGVLVLGLAACGWAWADRVEVDLCGPGWRLWQDKQAKWEGDELCLPPVDISKLPVNKPTGGWAALSGGAGLAVSVPGTAEEYLGDGGGPSSAVKGVTWWYRPIKVPAGPAKKVLLQVESARQRSEVYIDGKLAGYDIVGSSPFEVDLTGFARPGQTVQLAVRITNPGGTFEWYDYMQTQWGKYSFPLNHGFCGITGRVKLVLVDDVYLDDVYVQNTPAMRDVNVIATVRNTGPAAVKRDLKVEVSDGRKTVAAQTVPAAELKAGETTIKVPVSVPDAALWDTENPKLYTAKVTLAEGNKVEDSQQKKFGFRWFTVDGIGKDAVFRLNGKRVLLKTAISWGFWPTNGMYATPEMAEKQIRTAKSLGMNMLNFHRCIGSPVVFEKADELGLLYYEEPGSYVAGGREPFGQGISREKLLRMVKRDRSHPSLVIYNMINEQWDAFGADKDEALFNLHREDLRQAHALDPSRVITYASSWAYREGQEEKPKLHMRPFDDQQYLLGWQDIHAAMGPETWLQHAYRGPTEQWGYTGNAAEIVYRGEEGAISTPPRLEKIREDLRKLPRVGWDGAVYLKWYEQFQSFIDRKNLRSSFPTVDSLTCAMGAVSLEHQGRRIENFRVANVGDGYAINGWEAEISENHSGIVDCFRNPKADPAILAYYLQPLYVAVKARSQILPAGTPALVDLYAVNEKDFKGAYTLNVVAHDAGGSEVLADRRAVTLAGGDTFGQLLAEALSVPTAGRPGMWTIEATLADAAGTLVASGHDQVLVVDWRSDKITGNGAIYERGTRVSDFLRDGKGVDVPAYRDGMDKLDWIVVARPLENDPELIPASALRDVSGQSQGLTATFFSGRNFGAQVHQRTDAMVNLDVAAGATPDARVGMIEDYSVRWEGMLIPPVSGEYVLSAGGDDGVRLFIDGKVVLEDWSAHQYREQRSAPMHLEAGKPVQVKLEYFQAGGGAKCTLKWLAPNARQVDPDRLLERAARDGTTIIFLDDADTWLETIQKHSAVKASGRFDIGMNWLGGQFFAKKHALLEGLPADGAMNWPYQRVVKNGPTRFGMRLEGEELVAGAYQAWPMSLGTAIGVIDSGRGRIVVSSLDIAGALGDRDSSAEVARKMLCNYIRFAAEGKSNTR